jgi:regulator of sigma E protease
MWMTIKIISAPDSNIGPDQLAGPVGIARTKFLLLQEEHGWLRVLAFFVLFNVNLAVLNMLPLPVLDGGHIVMAILEWIRGKPLPARFLEAIQAGFALLLMGFMLYITTKDLGDIFTGGSKAPQLEWPEEANSG